ncbi:unnamed protein product [Camellia sinensis]
MYASKQTRPKKKLKTKQNVIPLFKNKCVHWFFLISLVLGMIENQLCVIQSERFLFLLFGSAGLERAPFATKVGYSARSIYFEMNVRPPQPS